MRDLGFRPNEVVVVGDSDADMGAAQAAGVAGVRIGGPASPSQSALISSRRPGASAPCLHSGKAGRRHVADKSRSRAARFEHCGAASSFARLRHPITVAIGELVASDNRSDREQALRRMGQIAIQHRLLLREGAGQL